MYVSHFPVRVVKDAEVMDGVDVDSEALAEPELAIVTCPFDAW